MSAAGAILAWAREHAVDAQEKGCSLKRFIFPSDFERYMYARMMTDRYVTSDDFNVVPTHTSGVTITTLIGIPCRFDSRLPNGKTLFLYDTGGKSKRLFEDAPPYPGDHPEPPKAA